MKRHVTHQASPIPVDKKGKKRKHLMCWNDCMTLTFATHGISHW